MPFLLYEIRSRQWKKKFVLQRPQSIVKEQSLVLLLPVWNEERLIERKLNDLASQGVRASLLLIDSASTDRTLVKAQDWLKRHPQAFTQVKIVTMSKRLGKSSAVQLALKHIQTDFKHDIVCMTDADATLENDALKRMMAWFSEKQIGAVGALPNRQSQRRDEELHRTFWDEWRVRESYLDSTPFLEGSCMMWRSELVFPDDIRTQSNADDTQIALAVRTKGYRAIVDEEIHFSDIAPWSRSEQSKQKIRRGQGLQRALLRYRPVMISNNIGEFRKVFRMQFHALILAPLLIVLTISVMLVRWVQYFLFGTPTPIFDTVLTMVEILFLSGLILIRYLKTNIPIVTLAGAWFSSMLFLQRGLFDIVRGKSHHMWDQLSEPRMLDVEFDL
ncbi:MAG: glycosyltransferase [archaeon]|nr:glycosyltransferase [archaeon]MDA1168393.1 glycosyltransferase [archaeon]